jgi:hypothetical protein
MSVTKRWLPVAMTLALCVPLAVAQYQLNHGRPRATGAAADASVKFFLTFDGDACSGPSDIVIDGDPDCTSGVDTIAECASGANTTSTNPIVDSISGDLDSTFDRFEIDLESATPIIDTTSGSVSFGIRFEQFGSGLGQYFVARDGTDDNNSIILTNEPTIDDVRFAYRTSGTDEWQLECTVLSTATNYLVVLKWDSAGDNGLDIYNHSTGSSVCSQSNATSFTPWTIGGGGGVARMGNATGGSNYHQNDNFIFSDDPDYDHLSARNYTTATTFDGACP